MASFHLPVGRNVYILLGNGLICFGPKKVFFFCTFIAFIFLWLAATSHNIRRILKMYERKYVHMYVKCCVCVISYSATPLHRSVLCVRKQVSKIKIFLNKLTVIIPEGLCLILVFSFFFLRLRWKIF